MSFKVIWSEFAESQLDEIYKYYEINASTEVARKIIIELLAAPNKLIKTPLIGQKEELLKHRKVEYRNLIFKNYKLIYSVDNEKSCIQIADVFDTRQNPIKLKRKK